MNNPINTFTVVDARTLDGNPYEVALAAVQQAAALVDLTAEYVDIARRMGRNAHDERELYFNGSIEHPFAGNGVDRQFSKLLDDLAEAQKRLPVLAKSVSADPRVKSIKEPK